MNAREVLFPDLFPTQAQPPKMGEQASKLTVDVLDYAMAALAPHFANAAPLARRNDPATSKAAAAALTSSRGRESAKAKVLAFLRARIPNSSNVPLTSAEIARDSGMQHPTVHKRLPDLRRDSLVENGPVRKCTVTGRPSLTWKAR